MRPVVGIDTTMLLRLLAPLLSATLVLGLCGTAAEARGVTRVTGVSGAGQDWKQAKFKVRWKAVKGARYQIRVSASPRRLVKAPLQNTRTAAGTFTRRLNRSLTWHVQV